MRTSHLQWGPTVIVCFRGFPSQGCKLKVEKSHLLHMKRVGRTAKNEVKLHPPLCRPLKHFFKLLQPKDKLHLSGHVRPRQATEICNFGETSPLNFCEFKRAKSCHVSGCLGFFGPEHFNFSALDGGVGCNSFSPPPRLPVRRPLGSMRLH